MTKRWGELYDTLARALGEAERLGDGPAQAWAKHELGTLHLARGHPTQAAERLEQARSERAALKDARGLKATNHNLATLCRTLQRMVREQELVARRGVRRRRPVMLVLIAAVLLLGVGVVVGAALAHGSRALAALAAEPATLTFAPASAQAPSVRTVLVATTGSAPAVLHARAFVGPARSDFRITADDCPSTLAPGRRCELTVSYLGAIGRAARVTLRVPYSGGNSPLEVPLVGPVTPAATATVTAAASPSGGGTVQCLGGGCTVPIGGSVTLATTANGGYRFSSWSEPCPGRTSSACTIPNVTGPMSVTANFVPAGEPKRFVVEASAHPTTEGSVSAESAGAPCPAGSCLVPSGGTVIITASAAPGYMLVSWTPPCPALASQTCTISSVTSSETVRANFSPAFTVIWMVNNVGDVTGTVHPHPSDPSATCTSNACTVSPGSTVTLTASPDQFVTWSGCDKTDVGTCTVTNIQANKNLTATFGQQSPP